MLCSFLPQWPDPEAGQCHRTDNIVLLQQAISSISSTLKCYANSWWLLGLKIQWERCGIASMNSLPFSILFSVISFEWHGWVDHRCGRLIESNVEVEAKRKKKLKWNRSFPGSAVSKWCDCNCEWGSTSLRANKRYDSSWNHNCRIFIWKFRFISN